MTLYIKALNDATRGKTEMVEVLILKADENGILRGKQGRVRNMEGQLIYAYGTTIGLKSSTLSSLQYVVLSSRRMTWN